MVLSVISRRYQKIFLCRLYNLRLYLFQSQWYTAPMGLDIGGQTPQEIAVSIMAQVIAVKNKDYMGTDKFSK